MLEGKIAAIIDDEAVVVNLGSDQGVSPGLNFAAVYEIERIPDPDDPQKTLGSLTFEIAKLQAVNVQPKMTYCKILDPYINRGFTLGTTINFMKTESKVDPSERQMGGLENLRLKVGTVVREVASQRSTK
jgi:hypothetical protein